jgi:hypothetical protein
MTQTVPANGVTAMADRTDSVGTLHLKAEHGGDPRQVLRWWAGDRWEGIPSWRYYRQVIRVALFLRERLRVAPGDRVLLASQLSPERVVAEWAVVTLGAVLVYGDGKDLVSRPKAAFVGHRDRATRPSEVTRLGSEGTIVFDARDLGSGGRTFAEVMDLGGTLDTAERAQSFRAFAATLSASSPAVEWMQPGRATPVTWSHRDLVDRIVDFWGRVPARRGDVAYLAPDARSLRGPYLPIWALVADGKTSTVLGAPGRQADEVAELDPHVLVGHTVALRPSGPREKGLEALARLPGAARLFRAARRRIREVLTMDGVRVRDQG